MSVQKSFNFGYLNKSRDQKKVSPDNSTQCENIELKHGILEHKNYAVDASDYLNRTTLFSEEREYVIADGVTKPFEAEGWLDPHGIAITTSNVETDAVYRLVEEDDVVTAEPIGIELPEALSFSVTKKTVAGSMAMIDSETTRTIMSGKTSNSYVLRMITRHARSVLSAKTGYNWTSGMLQSYIEDYVNVSASPSSIMAIPVYDMKWVKGGSPDITTKIALANSAKNTNMFSFGVPVSAEWQSTNSSTVNGIEGLPSAYSVIKNTYDAMTADEKTAVRHYITSGNYTKTITDLYTDDPYSILTGLAIPGNTSIGADKDENAPMFITPMSVCGGDSTLVAFDSGYTMSAVTAVRVYLRYIYKIEVSSFSIVCYHHGSTPDRYILTCPAFTFYTFFDVNVTEDGVQTVGTGTNPPQTLAFALPSFDVTSDAVVLKTPLFKTGTLSDDSWGGAKSVAASVIDCDTMAYNKEVTGEAAYNNKIDYALTVSRDTIYGADFPIESISTEAQGFYLFGVETLASTEVSITLPSIEFVAMTSATSRSLVTAVTTIANTLVFDGILTSPFAYDLLKINNEIIKINNVVADWIAEAGESSFNRIGSVEEAMTSSSGDFLGLWIDAAPEINDVIKIDDEQMLVTDVVGDNVSVTRGYNSTTAVAHLWGAQVSLLVTSSASQTIVPVISRGAYNTSPASHLITDTVYAFRNDIVAVNTEYGIDATEWSFDRINLYRFDTPLGFFQKITTFTIPKEPGMLPSVLTASNGTITLQYKDSLPQGSLIGDVMSVIGNYPPPIAKYLLSHYSKLFIVPKDEPNKIIYSKTAEPDYYPEGFDYTFDSEITGIAANNETLFIGTRSGLFCLYGDDENTFTLRNIFPEEDVEKYSLFTINGVAFFIVKNKGVFITAGGLPEKLSVPLGDADNALLEVLDGSNSHSYYLDKRFYVFQKQRKVGESFVNKYDFVLYDTENKGFITGYNDLTNDTPTVTNENGVYVTPYLYFGTDYPKQLIRAHVEYQGSITIEIFSNRSSSAILTRNYASTTRVIVNFWCNGLLSHFFYVRLTLKTHASGTKIFDFNIDRAHVIEADKLQLTT